MSNSAPNWRPYVVAQGDTLTSLAAKSGAPRDVIWTNPKNADLAKTRTNPDVLLPGDMLYLPPPPDQDPTSLQVGSVNTFVSPVEYMPIQVLMPEFAGSAYTALADGTALDPGSVEPDGKLALAVPVDAGIVEVTFTSPAGLVDLLVGHLDPVDSLSGRRQRLQNLGYVVPEPRIADSSSSGGDSDGDNGGGDASTDDDDSDDDDSDDDDSDDDDSDDDDSDDDANASDDDGGDAANVDIDYGGSVDGAGDDTNDHGLRRAMALYQEANGLPPSGAPDAPTLAQLEKDHVL